MLLAPSKLMNPNWQGLRCGERPNCPVKQVFHATLTGNGGFSAGAEALTWSQCGQYYKLSSHSSYAASTLTVDTGKSHCSYTHTFRLQAEGVTFPSCGLLGLNCLDVTGLFCTFSWLELHGNQEHGHNFLLVFWVFFFFLLVPRKVGMCLGAGITSLAQVRALAKTDLGSLTVSA